MPNQTLVASGSDSPAVTLDLRNFFAVPGVTGQIAQFDTVMGKFNVELLANDAPQTVANFLRYVNRRAYDNSFIHRSVPGFVVQGGGYTVVGTSVAEVPKDPAVVNEFRVPNTRGTVAMAKLGSDPNSATSEFFFNLGDNRSNLDNQNGGFTVFARVIGNGMSVVDAIAALQRVDAGTPFTELPVRNFSGSSVTVSNLIMVSSVTTASLFPTGGGNSVVSFTVQNSAANVVTAELSGSSLNLRALASGTATITVRAIDTHGAAAETSFTVSVTALAPSFLRQPTSQTVAAGSTVVLNATATNAASYRWQFNGVDIDGATSSALVINNAAGVHNGTYRVIASNPAGSITSTPATITVVNAPASEAGRLINLSILTNIRSAGDSFTLGYVVGGDNTSGAKPLVIRAAGPSLGALGFPGTVNDPKIELYAAGTKTGENDNWGGTSTLVNAFAAVGAFPFTPATSLDAAALTNVTTRDNSVRVFAGGSDSGAVIAEIYDATPAETLTASSPRLLNVSVLKQVDAGGSMTAGFVLRGSTGRTVLVRAIGPGLTALGVGGAMSDPQLELFNASSVQIAENDNWGGENFLRNAGTSVGAFAVQNSASRDAMLLTTLPPGNYTARVSGVANSAGNVIIEVYEVP